MIIKLYEEENILHKFFKEETCSGSVMLSENELLELYKTDPELAAKDCRLNALLNPQEPEVQPLTETEQMQIETYLNTAFIADMMTLSM